MDSYKLLLVIAIYKYFILLILGLCGKTFFSRNTGSLVVTFQSNRTQTLSDILIITITVNLVNSCILSNYSLIIRYLGSVFVKILTFLYWTHGF